MIPGLGPQIKEALTHLKRLSDSKRRANALKAADILISHGAKSRRDEYIIIVNEILEKEYTNYTYKASPPKQSI